MYHLLVDEQPDGTSLLFVDRHLIHEVTSPQAFEGLRNSNRKVRHPKLTLAVADHNVPTTDRSKGIADEDSKIQVETLNKNCKEFGVEIFGMDDKRQGIVHTKYLDTKFLTVFVQSFNLNSRIFICNTF